jgi:hypothetical protein
MHAPPTQRPTPGRIVTFLDPDARPWPAIVTLVEPVGDGHDPRLLLTVFTDAGPRMVSQVPLSPGWLVPPGETGTAAPQASTWHWPVRA